MKNIIYLLSILILLQSCFSYKTVDLADISVDKKQKLKIERIDNKNIKGKLVSISDDAITLKISGENKEISLSDIDEIRSKKFSFMKTAGLIPIYYALITVLGILALASFSL